MKKRLALLLAILMMLVAAPALAEEIIVGDDPADGDTQPPITSQTVETFAVVKPQFNLFMGAMGGEGEEPTTETGKIDVTVSWDNPMLTFDVEETDGVLYYQLRQATSNTVTFTVTNNSTPGILADHNNLNFNGEVTVEAKLVTLTKPSKYVTVSFNGGTQKIAKGATYQDFQLTYSNDPTLCTNGSTITTDDVTASIEFKITDLGKNPDEPQ